MTGISVTLVYSIVHNGFPSGAMICVLGLVPLDLPLIVPILTTGIVREGSEIAMSLSTASVTLLRLTALTALNTWFWYHGLDVSDDIRSQELRVFFFANYS